MKQIMRESHSLPFRSLQIVILTLLVIIGLPVAAVSQIAWDSPTGPAHQLPVSQLASSVDGSIYLASSWAGVLRSSDNGLSWFRPSAAAANTSPSTSVVTDGSGAVYTNAFQPGVYRSTDQGATWVKCADHIDGILAAGNVNLYGWHGDSLWVSTDQGTTWNYQCTMASALYDGEVAGMVIGRNGEFYCQTHAGQAISTDGGAHWTAPKTGVKDFDKRAWTFAANPATGTVYAASSKRLYRSTNSGGSWTFAAKLPIKLPKDFKSIIARYVAYSDASNGVYIAHGQQVARFDSATGTVTSYPEIAGKTGGLSCLMVNAAGKVVAGERGAGVRVFANSSWTTASLRFGGLSSGYLGLGPDSSVYACGIGGGGSYSLFKLAADSTNWTWLSDGPRLMTVLKNGTIVAAMAATKGNPLMISQNEGKTWKKLAKSPVNWSAVSCDTNLNVYAAYGGMIFKGANSGKKWKKIYEISSTIIDAITVDHAGNLLHAGTGVYLENKAAHTLTKILTNSAVRTVAVTTDSTILAGCDDGLYRSTDGGATWITPDAGLVTRFIHGLTAGPNGFVAAGTNTGAMVSTDNGATWADASTGLWGTDVNQILINPDGRLSATVEGRGVQRTVSPVMANASLAARNPNSVSAALPGSFILAQNYPNPFNPSTVISFTLPEDAVVAISVYDALGREVAKLVDGNQTAGERSVTWDASNLASGIYFCRMNAVGVSTSRKFQDMKKMLLVR